MSLEIIIRVPISGEVSLAQEALGAVQVTTNAIPEPVEEPPPVIGADLEPPPGFESDVVPGEVPDHTPPPPLVDLEAEAAPLAEAGPPPPSIEELEAATGTTVPEFDETPPSAEELGLDASLDSADLEPPSVEELATIVEETKEGESK